MERRNESISEALLSRLPRPENMAAYDEEVKSLLADNQRSLRRNRWTVVGVWVFVALVSAPFLWMAGAHFGTPQGNWFLGLTCFWVLFGAVEVLKYVIQQSRVALLKEIKQIQLQVFQLQAQLSKDRL